VRSWFLNMLLKWVKLNCYAMEPLRTVALATIPGYTLLFSLGAGPVPWLLYNEVFPTRIRARATGVCTAINYAVGLYNLHSAHP
jgi:hypothetical protein